MNMIGTLVARMQQTIVFFLQPSEEQVQALLSAFTDPAPAREQGIHFNGATYKCVRADKNSIYAKKARLIVVCVHKALGMEFSKISACWVDPYHACNKI